MRVSEANRIRYQLPSNVDPAVPLGFAYKVLLTLDPYKAAAIFSRKLNVVQLNQQCENELLSTENYFTYRMMCRERRWEEADDWIVDGLLRREMAATQEAQRSAKKNAVKYVHHNKYDFKQIINQGEGYVGSSHVKNYNAPPAVAEDSTMPTMQPSRALDGSPPPGQVPSQNHNPVDMGQMAASASAVYPHGVGPDGFSSPPGQMPPQKSIADMGQTAANSHSVGAAAYTLPSGQTPTRNRNPDVDMGQMEANSQRIGASAFRMPPGQTPTHNRNPFAAMGQMATNTHSVGAAANRLPPGQTYRLPPGQTPTHNRNSFVDMGQMATNTHSVGAAAYRLPPGQAPTRNHTPVADMGQMAANAQSVGAAAYRLPPGQASTSNHNPAAAMGQMAVATAYPLPPGQMTPATATPPVTTAHLKAPTGIHPPPQQWQPQPQWQKSLQQQQQQAHGVVQYARPSNDFSPSGEQSLQPTKKTAVSGSPETQQLLNLGKKQPRKVDENSYDLLGIYPEDNATAVTTAGTSVGATAKTDTSRKDFDWNDESEFESATDPSDVAGLLCASNESPQEKDSPVPAEVTTPFPPTATFSPSYFSGCFGESPGIEAATTPPAPPPEDVFGLFPPKTHVSDNVLDSDTMNEETASLKADHKTKDESLKEQYQVEIESLEEQHKVEIESLEEQHKVEIGGLKKQHKAEIESLEEQRKVKLEGLKKQLKKSETLVAAIAAIFGCQEDDHSAILARARGYDSAAAHSRTLVQYLQRSRIHCYGENVSELINQLQVAGRWDPSEDDDTPSASEDDSVDQDGGDLV